MKYAFMSFSTPELSLDKMLAAARRFGYDGIELRLDSGHAHGVETTLSAERRAEVRRLAQDSGVALACLATSLRYADPARINETMRETKERIALAAEVGVPMIRVFGGALPEAVTRDDAIDTLVHCLGMAGDWADAYGVTVCLETHDDWTDPRHVAAVLRHINLSRVGANWDVMHPVRTGKAGMQEAFDILRPYIRHVHVHDGTTRGDKLELRPIGHGEFDHRTVIRCLQTIGYEGFISGEWINWADPWNVHLPRELASLRNYEDAA